MTYEETLQSLFALLAQANLASSNKAMSWQRAEDEQQFCGNLYQCLNASIVAIAGYEIIEYWCITGEVDISLANRHVRLSNERQQVEVFSLSSSERYTHLNILPVDALINAHMISIGEAHLMQNSARRDHFKAQVVSGKHSWGLNDFAVSKLN